MSCTKNQRRHVLFIQSSCDLLCDRWWCSFYLRYGATFTNLIRMHATSLFCRVFALTVRLQVLSDFLGTAPHMLINTSHTTHYQTYMHPHAHTDTHKHIHSPVQIFARTLWSCEVKRHSQSASAVLCFALCSHVHPPPFHLVTAYLSACLSVPVVSHLFPKLPSSLLISFLLIFFHIASYSLSTSKLVLTQCSAGAVFWRHLSF